MKPILTLLIGVTAGMTTAFLADAQTTGTPVPAAVPPSVPAPVVQPVPASRWTVAQIRQAFELADSDSNGELTRSEAQRLSIMPRSFEDTDTNKDGVLHLGEYQLTFR